METSNHLYDIIVIGGGPAGSTCAAILAMGGMKVLLLEKDKFPRHHIGESLLPETFWPLKRSGALEKLRASEHVKKYSVAFASPEGRESKPFYFYETDPHESSQTWQVMRSEFDQMLLENAREKGVDAREEALVKEVLFEGDRAIGVRAKLKDGSTTDFACKALVDATGQNAIISNALGLRVRDPHLRKAVVYSYYKGAERLPGEDGGATLVLRTIGGNGWFWYIPLRDDVTSVGVVADPEYLLRGRGKDYQKILDEEIERCVAVKRRVATAKQCDKVYTTGDFSYRSTRVSGPGWVLIGDAYGFLDPIYSSGVLLALTSAAMAADSILDAFKRGDFSAESLGSFEPKLAAGIESMRKLVYAFYTEGFRFSKFLVKYPECRLNLIELLRGNVYKEGIDAIYGPMSEFFEVPPPIDDGLPRLDSTKTFAAMESLAG